MIILNNDAFVSLSRQKFLLSIAKTQKLIRLRKLLTSAHVEILQLTILYANLAVLLSGANRKDLFTLKFAGEALRMLETLQTNLDGVEKHRALFTLKNMQLFMM